MNGRRIEIGQVGIKFSGGQWKSQRAERIARLSFEHMQRLIATAPASGNKPVADVLRPGPLSISARKSDAEIAAAVAAHVRRSLMES